VLTHALMLASINAHFVCVYLSGFR